MWDAVGVGTCGGGGGAKVTQTHTDVAGAACSGERGRPAAGFCRLSVVLVQTVAEPHVAPAPLSMLSVGRDFDGADLTRSTTRYHGNMESGALGSRNPQHAV